MTELGIGSSVGHAVKCPGPAGFLRRIDRYRRYFGETIKERWIQTAGTATLRENRCRKC